MSYDINSFTYIKKVVPMKLCLLFDIKVRRES